MYFCAIFTYHIMEQPINPIKLKYNFAANYGLVLGAYIAFFYVLSLVFGANLLVNLLNMAGLIATPFLCYHLAVRYRDKGCNGVIRFGMVWSFGVWLFLFAGLIMAVVYFIHFQWIEPTFIENTFNQTLVTLEQMKYDQKALDTLADMALPTPIQMAVSYIFAYIIGGAILFLIIAPFVVKKPTAPMSTDSTPYQPYQSSGSSKEEDTDDKTLS